MYSAEIERRTAFPAGVETDSAPLPVHIHAIEEDAVAQHGSAAKPQPVVDLALDRRDADLDRSERATRERGKRHEHEAGREGIVAALGLRGAAVVAVPSEVTGLIAHPAIEEPAMGHDADITAGRKHASRERALDEIEVRFRRSVPRGRTEA